MDSQDATLNPQVSGSNPEGRTEPLIRGCFFPSSDPSSAATIAAKGSLTTTPAALAAFPRERGTRWP